MNCPICKLPYNKNCKPLVLDCDHTFCSNCVHLGELVKCHSCGRSSKPVINLDYRKYVMEENQTNNNK